MRDVNETPSIVITATGVACGLGLNAEAAWRAVCAARRGIGPLPDMESPLPPGSDGGQALPLPADFEPTLPREARYLRWAIRQALRQAGDLPCPPQRRAIMLGTTLHGMRAGGRFFRSNDFAQLADFLAGDVVEKAAAGLDLHGGAATTCSACSSSLGSVALGVTMLQRGEADVVIAGGYDPVSEYAWAGFNALRLVSGPPLRPFTVGRCGMKLAEAYAIVVLERADDAARRGQRSLATVAGWGESADAHHLTQPHPQGNGAAAAMRQALARAGVAPEQIGLISAHATGTPDNDAAEFAAMRQVFGERLAATPVVAFKSHLGHTLGAAGAIELIFSAMAMRDGVVPPTALDAGEQVEFAELRLNRSAAPAASSITATLNTSLGFGGANTSVVLRRADNCDEALDPRAPRHATDHAVEPGLSVGRSSEESTAHAVASVDRSSALTRAARDRAVVVTGVGLILPGFYARDDWLANPRDRSTTPAETIDFARVESIVSARRVRRMSDYVKLTLAAATLAGREAFGDAGVPADTAAILGTTHGSAGFSETYYRQLIAEGVSAANPLLFAEGVPNAAAAQLSLMLGLTGACQTIVGTQTAGLDALRLAMLRIGAGEIDRCIVSAGEEDSPIVAAAYARCADGVAAAFDHVAGAVALVLESADGAAARGATALATLTHAATASGPRTDLLATTGRVLESLPAAGRFLATGRVDAVAGRQLGLAGDPETSALLGERFSTTALLAVVLAIDTGASVIVSATDPSGLAATVRVARER